MTPELRRGEYLISTDKSRLDLGVVHDFLSTSYWVFMEIHTPYE